MCKRLLHLWLSGPCFFLSYFFSLGSYARSVIEDHGHLPSWGLVGHSQGGLVSLHLHNFYWSPNDAVVSSPTSRPVQTVGTPFLGVSGTGVTLDIGALFGLGCGDNFDLSRDGANLWMVTRKTSFCFLVFDQ